jgi:hypothetical protein
MREHGKTLRAAKLAFAFKNGHFAKLPLRPAA